MGPVLLTLLDHFARTAEASPERSLFLTSEGALSYGEAATAVARGVEQLRAMELAPGSHVLCLAEDTIPLAQLLLAAGYARVLPTAISPLFSSDYVAAVARQSGARAVFTTPAFVEQAAALGLPLLCYDGDGAGASEPNPPNPPNAPGARRPPSAIRVFRRAGFDPRAAAALRQLASSVRLTDPFLLQATAGSTGTPKLVLRPFEAFARYARFVGDEVRKLELASPPRMLAICSLTHAFAGHMFAVAMSLGAELAVPRLLDARAQLDELRHLDPDLLPMTPRVLDALLRQPAAAAAIVDGDEPRCFGPRARLVLSAGGKANVQSFERLRAQRLEVMELYGSSEASVVAVTPLGAWRPGCAGVPVADVELEVGRDGELLVRSPGLALGYHADPEGRQLVGEGGFYRTGDIGRLDEAGYLEILGRKRDVFCTPEGSNIYPDRIEQLLESLDGVAQALVLGDGKSFVTAHLVLRDPPPGSSSCIDGHAHAALYERLGDELMALNERLELIEQVVAFALYRRPFPEAAYRAVAGAKIARDRRAFTGELGPFADRLYSGELPCDSPMLVPPKERHFAARIEQRQRRRGEPPSPLASRAQAGADSEG